MPYFSPATGNLLNFAQQAIADAKWRNATGLFLNNMGLTDEVLEGLMPSILEIPNLRTLNLSRNMLTTLPASIGQLQNLEILEVHFNQLQRLPPQIGHLARLRRLDLQDHRLSTLPPEFGNLVHLEVLNISIMTDIRLRDQNIGLQSLPPEFGNLIRIRVLNISNNRLKELPLLGGLETLENLDLRDNEIAVFPATLLDLPSVKNLFLGGNQLETCSENIRAMVTLEILDLARNQLRELPEGICNLGVLRILDLSHNLLSDLPNGLGGLDNLRRLILRDNRLDSIPQSLHDLGREMYVDVSANLLTEMHLGQLREMFNYLETDSLDMYEYRVQKLFGADSARVMAKIAALDLQPVAMTEGVNAEEYRRLHGNYRAKEAALVVKEFIEKVPTDNPHSKTIYIPAVTMLLDQLLNQSIPNHHRQMMLAVMASALGNCDTPIHNFLTQLRIGQFEDQGLEFPEELQNVMVAMALESAISTQLREILGPVEFIEKVMALRNSVFLKDAANMAQNKVRIQPSLAPLASATRNIDMGFNLITAEAAKAFARMCCQTNIQGDLITEDGLYLLDPQKMNTITEHFYASLGRFSPREKAVQEYRNQIKSALGVGRLTTLYEIKEVSAMININQQENELRAELACTPDEQVWATVHQRIQEMLVQIRQLEEKYQNLFPIEVSQFTVASVMPQQNSQGDHIFSAAGPSSQNRTSSFPARGPGL